MAVHVMAKKETMDIFRNRRCHVIGIGRSGVGSANLLSSLGAIVSISDRSDGEYISRYLRELDTTVKYFTGRQDAGLVSSVDTVVISPGVPSGIDLIQAARKGGAEVMGEIELSYRVLSELREKRGITARIFAVTGTNGKSTTTALLYEMVRRANNECILAGNIGTSLAAEVNRIVKEGRKGKSIDIVLELSSFQLETIRDFTVDVAGLLNINPDHLDRYASLDEYARAKGEIFRNQTPSHFAVINADDETAVEYSRGCKAMKYYASIIRKVEGIHLQDEEIVITIGNETRRLASRSDVSIPGPHNLSNAMVASMMAYISGVPPEHIVDALKSFPGLEHRIELVAERDGVKFYNDSKGTNVAAVIKSLESFKNGIVLIAGGRDKNSDFTLLRPLVKERVKRVVLIGEATGRIREALEDVTDIEFADSMDDAVRKSIDASSAGDTVLLSPACASFDMFDNYEDRGRRFKDAVRRLLGDRK